MTDFDLDELELDVLRRDIERLAGRKFCRRDLRMIRDMSCRLIEIANQAENANADR